MTRKLSLRRGSLFVAATILALLALFGTACRAVQPPGVEPQDPTGVLDFVAGGNDEVRIAGWATQWVPWGDPPNLQRPAQIVVMLNGEWLTGAVAATNPRPDVQQYLWDIRRLGPMMQPNAGYGFDFTKPAPKGEATVCVVALNQCMDEWGPYGAWGGSGPPEHVLLGCRTVTVT